MKRAMPARRPRSSSKPVTEGWPDETECVRLHLRSTDRVFRTWRVHFAMGVPFMAERTTLAAALFPGLADSAFPPHGILDLARMRGIALGAAHEQCVDRRGVGGGARGSGRRGGITRPRPRSRGDDTRRSASRVARGRVRPYQAALVGHVERGRKRGLRKVAFSACRHQASQRAVELQSFAALGPGLDGIPDRALPGGPRGQLQAQAATRAERLSGLGLRITSSGVDGLTHRQHPRDLRR